MSTAKKTPAALFDFDGTITRADTMAPFLTFLFRHRPESRMEIPRLAALAPLYASRLLSKDQMKAQVLRCFSRIPTEEQEQVLDDFHEKELRPRYLKGALERIDWHKKQGHKLLLVSASVELYLQKVAEALGFDLLIATRTSLKTGPSLGGNGALDSLARNFLSKDTPKLLAANCYGHEKVNRLQAWRDFNQTDWPASWAYSDHISDLPMLMLCGHPVATTPHRKLKQHALRQGWRMMNWR